MGVSMPLRRSRMCFGIHIDGCLLGLDEKRRRSLWCPLSCRKIESGYWSIGFQLRAVQADCELCLKNKVRTVDIIHKRAASAKPAANTRTRRCELRKPSIL